MKHFVAAFISDIVTNYHQIVQLEFVIYIHNVEKYFVVWKLDEKL